MDGGVVAIAHPIHATTMRKRYTIIITGISKAQSRMVLSRNLMLCGAKNNAQKYSIIVAKLKTKSIRP